MNVSRDQLCLYAITDRKWLTEEQTLAEAVAQAIRGGATIIQLREKNLSGEEYLSLIQSVQHVCKAHHIPFILNDSPELAIAVNADGVHIGQSDGNVAEVRNMIGPEKILGVSARTVEQALQAEKDGADYLGCGAVFGTSTKADAEQISLETLQQICNAVHIPVVAIGGVNAENMMLLEDSGIAGVAVISAIFAKPDIRAAAEQLRDNMRRIIEKTTSHIE